MASIPFKIMLYVFIGSVPVKGGVPVKQKKSKKKIVFTKKSVTLPVKSSNIKTPRDQ